MDQFIDPASIPGAKQNHLWNPWKRLQLVQAGTTPPLNDDTDIEDSTKHY